MKETLCQFRTLYQFFIFLILKHLELLRMASTLLLAAKLNIILSSNTNCPAVVVVGDTMTVTTEENIPDFSLVIRRLKKYRSFKALEDKKDEAEIGKSRNKLKSVIIDYICFIFS
jgi:hypothetical protein